MGANAVIITYDITNKTTFANTDWWRKKVEKWNEDVKDDIIHVLVGCKADLEHLREVKTLAISLNSIYGHFLPRSLKSLARL